MGSRAGSTMMRLASTFLQRRASRVAGGMRCSIPSMVATASSLDVPALPPTALLNPMRALSTLPGHWFGGGGVGIKYGSAPLSTLSGHSESTNTNVKGGMTHKASQQLATELRQMITKGDRNGAWKLFNAARATGAADVLHWNMTLKLCNTSSESRRMMDEMVEAGLKPSGMTYEILVKQLMLEGKYEDARAVQETEMPSAAIIPTKHTESLFSSYYQQTTKWSRTRLDHLQGFIKSNAVEQADEFFELLKANGVANVFHWTMMQGLCDTSVERCRMIEEMVEAGVKPTFMTYNNLVNQLMIEGKYQEARAVVETEMPAAGVEPNDRTQSVLEKPEEDLSRMRTKHLQDLLKTNTPETRRQAQVFFEGLTVNRVAKSFQYSIMLTHCDTSAEQRSMMEEMAAAGVQPNFVTYNILANKLMFEGKYQEARAVVDTEMPAAGAEPNDRTQSVLVF